MICGVENWSLDDGATVPVARVARVADLPDALRALGIEHTMPAIVVVGGAESLHGEELLRLGPLFSDGLVPLADSLGAAIVDGGTDAGVMRLIGRARAETTGSFPLIGVVPTTKVRIPGRAHAGTQLESHHTQIILVPAASWAAGSPWLALAASAVAGEKCAVTVLIGGGEVSWIDAQSSVDHGRPLIAVRGTGGVADALSAALTGASTNPRATEIAASGLLSAVDFAAGPAAVAAAVSRAIGAPDSAVNRLSGRTSSGQSSRAANDPSVGNAG